MRKLFRKLFLLFRQNIRVKCATNINIWASGKLSETHAIDSEGNKKEEENSRKRCIPY